MPATIRAILAGSSVSVWTWCVRMKASEVPLGRLMKMAATVITKNAATQITQSTISDISSRLVVSSFSRLSARRFSVALASLSFMSTASPLNKSFIVMPKSWQRTGIFPASGKQIPFSHLETALSLTPIFSASADCVSPAAFLQEAMKRPILT